MNRSDHTILVTGATGQQGGAVARRLLADGWAVRALTRDSSQDAARALTEAGAEVVEGDLDDAASLAAALEGVYGVYSVQQFWGVGAEGEIAQGGRLIDAAAEAGVRHLVQSSVAAADADTGISHFESKATIEQHLKASGLRFTIIRPVFFMENFFQQPSQDAIRKGMLALALPADVPLQMVAVEDIGRVAAQAFAEPEAFAGETVELAGDERTGPEITEAFEDALGTPVRYVAQDPEQLPSDELAVMFRWFAEVGYDVDIPALRVRFPGLLTLDDWVQRTGWVQGAGLAT